MQELLTDVVLGKVLTVYEYAEIANLRVVLLVYLFKRDETELETAQKIVFEEQIIVRHLNDRERRRDHQGLLAVNDERK